MRGGARGGGGGYGGGGRPVPGSSPSSYAPPPAPLPPLADLRAEARFLVTCHPGASAFLADELRALLPPGSAAQSSVAERRGGSLAGAATFSVPLSADGGAAPAGAGADACGPAAARRLARRAVLRLRTATRVLELVGEADLDPRRPAGDTVYEAVRAFGRGGGGGGRDGDRSRSSAGAATTSTALLGERGWAALLPGGGGNGGGGGTLGAKAQLWANSNVSNSQLVARRVRDACLDAVREATGQRPAPPPTPSSSSFSSGGRPRDERDDNDDHSRGDDGSGDGDNGAGASAGYAGPSLPLFAALTRDRLSLYRDWAGRSLHRRAYRRGAPVHKAALNECAAAALLAAAGWWDPSGRGMGAADAVLAEAAALSAGGEGGDTPAPSPSRRRLALVDPMCGSGTMLVEAALVAVRAAPGLLRCDAAAAASSSSASSSASPSAPAHAFERWPDHEARLWREELEEARRERAEGERAWRRAAAAALGGGQAVAAVGAEEGAAAAPPKKRRGRPPSKQLAEEGVGVGAAAAGGVAGAVVAAAPPLLFGSDVDDRALALARHSARQAGVDGLIGWRLGDCSERGGQALCEAAAEAAAAAAVAALAAAPANGAATGADFLTAPPRLAVANPPWGVRLLPWEEESGGAYILNVEHEDDDDQEDGQEDARFGGGGGGGRRAPRVDDGAAAVESAAQATWDDLRAALKALAAVGGDPDATLSAWVLSGNDRLSLGLRSERKRVLLAGGRRLAWLSFLVRPARAAAAAGAEGGGVGEARRERPRQPPQHRRGASSTRGADATRRPWQN